MENYETWQDILDGILLKTDESVQNFPVENRTVSINEEYLFLYTLINKYNVGKEWTAANTDNNWYDQTLTAGDTELPNLKQGVIRKVEFQLTGESYWHTAERTSVRAFEGLCGSVSEAIETVTIPEYFIERDGNIQLLGELSVDATVRIFISDDLKLLTSGDEAEEPRLPLFARVLLVLAPSLEFMDRHNMLGVGKYEQRYITVLKQLRDSVRETAPPRKLKMKSVRRK